MKDPKPFRLTPWRLTKAEMIRAAMDGIARSRPPEAAKEAAKHALGIGAAFGFAMNLGGEEVQRLLRMGENIGQVEAARVQGDPDEGEKVL